MKLLIVPAILAALALHASVASADGGCHAIFKAGHGYIDSCTGEQRSPYIDLVYPTPKPAPVVVVEREVVYVQVPAVKKSSIPVPYPYIQPVQNCGYVFNILGRCPVAGDKWVYDSETGKVYPGTSVVPPYSDQATAREASNR